MTEFSNIYSYAQIKIRLRTWGITLSTKVFLKNSHPKSELLVSSQLLIASYMIKIALRYAAASRSFGMQTIEVFTFREYDNWR